VALTGRRCKKIESTSFERRVEHAGHATASREIGRLFPQNTDYSLDQGLTGQSVGQKLVGVVGGRGDGKGSGSVKKKMGTAVALGK